MIPTIFIVVGAMCFRGTDLKPVIDSNMASLQKRAVEQQRMFGVRGWHTLSGNGMQPMPVMMSSSMFFLRPWLNLFQPLMSMAATQRYAQNAFGRNNNMMVSQGVDATPERDEEHPGLQVPFAPMEDGSMMSLSNGGQTVPVTSGIMTYPFSLGSTSGSGGDFMEGPGEAGMEGPGEAGVDDFAGTTGSMNGGHMGFDDAASWNWNGSERDNLMDRQNMEHFVEQTRNNAGSVTDDLRGIRVEDLTHQAVTEFLGPEHSGEDMNGN